jgi:GNAT superfamily N-acetyltransferase
MGAPAGCANLTAVRDELRRATAGDAPVAAEILADGFRDDPVMLWVFGSGIDSALRPFFQFMAGEALIPLGATYVSDCCCAVWTPPGQDPWAREEIGADFLSAMSDVLDREQLTRLVRLNTLVDEIHPDEPHWYLGMIATTAASQGTGAGTRMLRHTLRLVDDQRLPSYLESTNPRNIPFYQRNGFSVVRHADLPDGPSLTQMKRDLAL